MQAKLVSQHPPRQPARMHPVVPPKPGCDLPTLCSTRCRALTVVQPQKKKVGAVVVVLVLQPLHTLWVVVQSIEICLTELAMSYRLDRRASRPTSDIPGRRIYDILPSNRKSPSVSFQSCCQSCAHNRFVRVLLLLHCYQRGLLVKFTIRTDSHGSWILWSVK